MFPFPSTAMPLPLSSLLPPRSVENNKPEPDEFSLVTKASLKKPKPVPAYKSDEPPRTRVRTDVFHRPAFELAQFVPPFVDLTTPALPTAAYTAEEVTTIAVTVPCGTWFVSGSHEVAPLVLLFMPPEAWPV